MVAQSHSLQASTRQLVRIAQLGRTSEAEDGRSQSHRLSAAPEAPEAPGPRPGSTARVRFLRKTYQQTRQFIGEDAEEGSSSEESDEDATVDTTASDGRPAQPGRRLSALAQHMPRKEYLWRKVQAVAFGTRRAMQQRNRLLTQLKSSIQECVERQRVAKQVQAAVQNAGSDVLAGLRASLDDASIAMLEEIVSDAAKFQVLNIPSFVQDVLEYTMGDSEHHKTALQDSLLDAMQDAMEVGGDLFELDELRTNVMDKVEAFKLALRKASRNRVQDKLKSLEPPEPPEAEVTEAPDVEEPTNPASVDPNDSESEYFMSPTSSYGETMSEAGRRRGAPAVVEAALDADPSMRFPWQASAAQVELPPIKNLDAASDARDKALQAQECRSCRSEGVSGHLAEPGAGQAAPPLPNVDPCGGCAAPEVEVPAEALPDVSARSTSRRSDMSSPRPPMIKAQSEGFRRIKSHEPNWKEHRNLLVLKAEAGECETEEPSLTARSQSMYRSTWHGRISEKLVVLGPATVERLVAQAEGTDGARFPVLPMYRSSTKEAVAKRPDFRQKQKAVSLDHDLPQLGHIQPSTSFSVSKGSGRFGYTLPEPPRRLRRPPATSLVSPRRNPPSHPAPRQIAWTLLPGIAD